MDIATSCCATIPSALQKAQTREALETSCRGGKASRVPMLVRVRYSHSLLLDRDTAVRGALRTRSTRCTDPRGTQTPTLKPRGSLTQQIQRWGRGTRWSVIAPLLLSTLTVRGPAGIPVCSPKTTGGHTDILRRRLPFRRLPYGCAGAVSLCDSVLIGNILFSATCFDGMICPAGVKRSW